MVEKWVIEDYIRIKSVYRIEEEIRVETDVVEDFINIDGTAEHIDYINPESVYKIIDPIKMVLRARDGGTIKVEDQNAFLITEDGELLCTEPGELFNMYKYSD